MLVCYCAARVAYQLNVLPVAMLLVLHRRYGIVPDSGVEYCQLCPLGTYSDPAGQCEGCPTNMITLQPGQTSSTSCVCKVAHGLPSSAATAGCVPCSDSGTYQGRLDQDPLNFLVPITTATPENPRPPCQKCPVDSGIYVGNVKKECLGSGTDTGPGAYCVNRAWPTGGSGAFPNLPPACAFT